MDLIEETIVKCKDKIMQGYGRKESSGIEWLNDLCLDFNTLVKNIHKFLIFEGCLNKNIVEICLLCISQIMGCLKYLEITIETEIKDDCVLTSTRQCFLDRIVWCLAKLDSAIIHFNLAASGGVSQEMEANFLNYLDTALEVISPFTTMYKFIENSINVADQNAEAMLASKEIRSIIEALIGQTFAFLNICLQNDKRPLTVMCQRILKECIEFEKESSLNESRVVPNEQTRKLKATILENSLYQLENLISECLLRVVCEVFSDFDNNLLERLKKLKGQTDDENIETLTNEFDYAIDRIFQIGVFAVTYAEDYKTAATIRSCLASLESLDSHLIPSLFSQNEQHSKIIQNHWTEEMAIFRTHIQKIVDTNAFNLSLIEIIENGIESLMENFDCDLASSLLRKANLFKQHLDINDKNLKVNLEDNQGVKDFKLMIKECSAVLVAYKESENTIGEEKVLKRFKILLNKLKQVQQTIGSSCVKVIKNEEKFEVDRNENANELKEFFDSFDIQQPSILYRTRKNSEIFSSPRSSTKIMKDILPFTPDNKKHLSRKNSLRKAMFKKNTEYINHEDVYVLNQSISLHLTEILEQLTDLSTTLTTTSVQQNKINENIAFLENNKIRISITSDSVNLGDF